ncbi:hypothetical protein COO60DRAFT_1568738, partial [Scenedesmus sp. NREL 46B-D3]
MLFPCFILFWGRPTAGMAVLLQAVQVQIYSVSCSTGSAACEVGYMAQRRGLIAAHGLQGGTRCKAHTHFASNCLREGIQMPHVSKLQQKRALNPARLCLCIALYMVWCAVHLAWVLESQLPCGVSMN